MNSGKELIELIETLAGRKGSSPYAIKKANEAWDAWEKQGITRGADTEKVIYEPDKIFKSYYLDIIKANDLEENNVYFCYAKTGDLNALASTTKNGDHVIIFDSGLQVFINNVIITLIVCVYSTPSDQEVEFYFNHIFKEILEFKGLSSNFSGNDDFMKIITKDYDLTMLGSYCGASIFTFIICHEIAHHILGHTKKRKKMAMTNHKGEIDHIDIDDVSQLQEFDADSFGFELYTSAIKNYSSLNNLKLNNQFLSVPLSFFLLLDILELFASPSNSTHPPANDRLNKINDLKIKINMNEDMEFYDALCEVIKEFKVWCENKVGLFTPKK